MRIIYDIKPKNNEEYCDVIDAFSDWLDRNNIEHKKSETFEEWGQNKEKLKLYKKIPKDYKDYEDLNDIEKELEVGKVYKLKLIEPELIIIAEFLGWEKHKVYKKGTEEIFDIYYEAVFKPKEIPFKTIDLFMMSIKEYKGGNNANPDHDKHKPENH